MAKKKWTIEEIEQFRETHNIYFIYCNKEDANLFVPRADNFRRWSITGMTINLAHPISILFSLVLLAVILFPVFIDFKYGLR
jgi:uncharacterized membrane protein